ncbi:MAG: hypothetical protein HY898_14705 [Deltaproteobacteria bacterium]|nr:hypothetical protein [Deltaproteobacteria bacterium]
MQGYFSLVALLLLAGCATVPPPPADSQESEPPRASAPDGSKTEVLISRLEVGAPNAEMPANANPEELMMYAAVIAKTTESVIQSKGWTARGEWTFVAKFGPEGLGDVYFRTPPAGLPESFPAEVVKRLPRSGPGVPTANTQILVVLEMGPGLRKLKGNKE